MSRATITLPPRAATVAAECDVLVVGGGPAGLGAALGAADAGADVILVERYAFLGGNATAALVMPLMSFHTQRGSAAPGTASELMPHDHGPGDPVVQGALKRLLDRLESAGGSLRPSPQTGYVVPFDPEIFKLVALDLLDEAGVRALLYAFASGVVGAPRPDGVVFETKSGPIVVMARAIVDATGDGDVAALAGAPFEVGRAGDALVQPMTLMFRMVEFERNGFAAYRQAHPDQWRGVHGLWDLVREASAAGRAGARARGHPLLRHAARAGAVGQQHAGDRRARHQRVGSHAGRVAGSPPDEADRRLPAQVRAGLRAVVPGPERRDDRGARDAPHHRGVPAHRGRHPGRAEGGRRDRARERTRSTSTIRRGRAPC